MSSDVSTRQSLKTLQIATALVYCLFSVGIAFGFAALKKVLISSGVYSDRCILDTAIDARCVEQEIALNNMFTWAAVGTNVSAFPIGLLLDRFGPRVASLIGSFCILIGSFGLSLANENLDIYVQSYCILATGGAFLLLSSFSLASLVPSKSGLIVSAMTGAFDASSGLFLIYRVVYQSIGQPSIKTFFSWYCIVPILIFIAQVWYMPRGTTEGANSTSDDESSSSQTDLTRQAVLSPSETTHLLDRTDDTVVFTSAKRLVDPIDGVMHEEPTIRVLTSLWFLLPALSMVTSLIRVNFYIATVNAQLVFLLGKGDASLVMNLFDLLLPVGGIFAIPVIGYVIDTFTTPTVYFLTLLLSLSSGILSFIPNKYAQILHIITFVVLRPWIYSILPGTVTKLFGNERFGAFYGLIMGVAGLVNLLSHNLEVLTYSTYNGNFYPVDAGLVILSCAALVATSLHMRIKVSRMAQ